MFAAWEYIFEAAYSVVLNISADPSTLPNSI